MSGAPEGPGSRNRGDDGVLLMVDLGSSSRRYALYPGAREADDSGARSDPAPETHASSQLSGAREPARTHMEKSGDRFWITGPMDAPKRSIRREDFDRGAAFFLETLGTPAESLRPAAMGIRVVAPGKFFQGHRLIDEGYMGRLERAEAYAPLHVAPVLSEVRALRRAFPGVPLAGISDSAFHASLPACAARYSLPEEDAEKYEIYRYGYHGISAQSVLTRLGGEGSLPAHLVICHLGNGSSVMAVKQGRSVEASMGFSPLEGLIMGSRVGDIDASAVLHLLMQSGMDARGLQTYLNTRCGLLGLSGASNDMRALSAAEAAGDKRAALAIEAYVHRVRKYIGASAAALGGLDMLVFTGGIGEHSPRLRARICAGMEWMGVGLDPARNSAPADHDAAIHDALSTVRVRVLPADELAEMARLTRSLIPEENHA